MINYNDDKRIDPKFYRNDGSERRNVLKILVIILVVGVIGYILGTSLEETRLPALPGEVILRGDMDISAANERLEKAGFIPMDEVKTDDDYDHLFYESSEVYGYPTTRSELAVARSGKKSVSFIHYFDDESKENNMNNPGEVYVYIASQVTVRSRETPHRPAEDRDEIFWMLRRGPSVHMTYADDGVVMLEYRYTD